MSEQKANTGNTEPAKISKEMEVAYRDYAMSVLVSRALPDVRDGLKPVHRRILYAMHHDLRLHSGAPHKKSARVVGEVLGKYHPHSDQSIYDAMVRMAQPFSLRYPLVDGQGNMGSVDGDNPAAMRYTEVRLSRIAELMLPDLDKDTVDWRPNFDDTLQEPALLPALLPNLLVNGANGIAVGMATQIPPHNALEVCAALDYLLDHFDQLDDISVTKLMEFIRGPDFPTGGLLYTRGPEDKENRPDSRLHVAYGNGRGSVTVQAKVHVEESGMGRSRLVVTEIPYQANKSHLIDRIVLTVRRDQVEGIVDVRDESDRAGMRICIELNRSAHPQEILQRLFQLTPLQQSYGISMVALVDGRPSRVTLLEILINFIEHRREVVRRRSKFDLKAAQARLHIVEGLLRALDEMDAVIQTIRGSSTQEEARTLLMERFEFTSEQVRAILAMPLRQLVGLEVKELREEFRTLHDEIRSLQDLLASETRLRSVIKEELDRIRERLPDARRTRIMDRPVEVMTAEELAPDLTVWVTLSRKGTAKRYAYRGMRAGRFKEIGRNGSLAAATANTRDVLYLFSKHGVCQRVQVFRLPDAGTPRHIGEYTGFTRRDALIAALPLAQASLHDDPRHLCLVTRQGMIKRIHVNMLIEAPGEEISVINLKKGDELGWVLLSNGGQEVMLFTARGRALRFSEDEARALGLGAAGVRCMNVDKTDSMVSAALAQAESAVLSVTHAGYVKRTPISEYPVKARGGKGVIAHKLSDSTGLLAGALTLADRQEDAKAILHGDHGAWLLDVNDIPESGRATQGRRLAQPAEEEMVSGLGLLWSAAPAGAKSQR